LEESGCRDGYCPAGVSPGSYPALRATSMIGLYAGLGCAVPGAMIFLLTPTPSKSSARVEPWIGAGSVGVRGAF
jgi:hypothetical protein